MHDYLNELLAEMKYDDLIKNSDAMRIRKAAQKKQLPIQEKFILKMADYMIEKGHQIKEHHLIPKGA